MKKKNDAEPPMDVNAWMITFSDLLTLMLTFFVLLISMSTLDNKRIREIFGLFPGAVGTLEMGSSGEVGQVYVLPPRALAEEGTTISTTIEEMRAQARVDEIIKKEKKSEKMHSQLEELAAAENMDIQKREDQFHLNIQESMLFRSGSASLSGEGEDILMRLCGVLAHEPNRISVEGHADDRPIHTDRYPSNWELSLTRAVTVVRFMAERGGVDPGRLSAVGYGSTRNIFPNDTEEHRSLNRRVEISIKE